MARRRHPGRHRGRLGHRAAFTPPEYVSFVFDLLAPQSVALTSDIRVLRTEHDQLVVPHLLSDQTASWRIRAASSARATRPPPR
jgi:hypothetical protein